MWCWARPWLRSWTPCSRSLWVLAIPDRCGAPVAARLGRRVCTAADVDSTRQQHVHTLSWCACHRPTLCRNRIARGSHSCPRLCSCALLARRHRNPGHRAEQTAAWHPWPRGGRSRPGDGLLPVTSTGAPQTHTSLASAPTHHPGQSTQSVPPAAASPQVHLCRHPACLCRLQAVAYPVPASM